MAAPADAPEQAFRLRKFQGTNTELDSTFIGPSFVSRSENWIPSQNYRLAIRPGTTLLQHVGLATTNITSLVAARRSDGQLFLFAYGWRTALPDHIAQSQAEGPFVNTSPGATFPSTGAPGRMIQFRDRMYAGNGIDPLVSWKLGDDPANTLTFGPITNLGDKADAAAVVAAAGASTIPAGTYSYCWALFNLPGHTNPGLYDGRTNAASITISAQNTIKFPVLAAGTNQEARLFVSPRNYPIEYATMQAHAPTADVVLDTVDVTDTRVPLAGGTLELGNFRTGNMFVIWTNRVVFAGSRTDPMSVFATDVILPGLEQAGFNQGTLFPDFAKVPLPQVVTGLGIAGVTTDQDATSPLLFFTLSRTFLVQGDPFDPQGQATLVEVSSRVGCIAHDSIVNTPFGTIFVGLDSIYLIPPGGGYPQNIGWPIADQIRSIPPPLRQRVCATFHKQFYKLALPVSGGADNVNQWWLDLRQGLAATPSWWGPMTGLTLHALATDPSSTSEVDRGYAALPGDQVVLVHQLNTYMDMGIPVASKLTSGRFDADQPFIPKIFTRLRLIAQVTTRSFIHVVVQTDGGVTWSDIPVIPLGQDMDDPGEFVHLTPVVPPPPPINKSWGHLDVATGIITSRAKFGTISPVEAQTIMPYERPRGLSAVVTLIHDPARDRDLGAHPGNVELRDFEFLFLLSGRKVRYTGFSVSSTSGTRSVRPERVSK